MEDYNLISFTNKLKEWFTDSPLFPYYEIGNADNIGLSDYSTYQATKQSAKSKHPNRSPTHLKDIAKECLNTTTIIANDMILFDYGNSIMERNYPHYHILENSPVIRKAYHGTKKSKGSEMYESNVGKRDYEKVLWNGKTFTKEYKKNVRGIRNRMSKVSHWGIVDGQGKWLNKESNSYLNTHYKYIENILDNDVIYRLASEFGMKLGRKQDTGLIDEFAMQQDTSVENIIDIFGSFME